MTKEEKLKLEISLLEHRKRHLKEFVNGPAFGWGDCHERRVVRELLLLVDEKIIYFGLLLETEVNP